MAYRRLPVTPSLENLKNQAKSLLAAYRDGEEQAVTDFAAFHPDGVAAAKARLTDAQLVLARSYRQPSWPRMFSAVEIRRALHGDDVGVLKKALADYPEAMGEPSAAGGAFSESTPVKQRNVHGFLRTFAQDISPQALKTESHAC